MSDEQIKSIYNKSLCISYQLRPDSRKGTPADYDNYPLLCEAIRKAFNEAGHPEWLITVATSINSQKLKDGYDMVAMAPHIDWFNVSAVNSSLFFIAFLHPKYIGESNAINIIISFCR